MAKHLMPHPNPSHPAVAKSGKVHLRDSYTGRALCGCQVRHAAPLEHEPSWLDMCLRCLGKRDGVRYA